MHRCEPAVIFSYLAGLHNQWPILQYIWEDSGCLLLMMITSQHLTPGHVESHPCLLMVIFLQRPPMMHRDLKSPNVLLSEEGVAKIADVGMVRSQVKDLVTAQPVMTPLWAAPEVGWHQ